MAMLGLNDAYAMLTDQERQRSAVISDPNQPDNPLVFVSHSFMQQTGYRREEVVGRNCRFLQGPDTDPADINAIRQALENQRPLTIDILNYRKNGAAFWNRLRLRPVLATSGELLHYVGVQNPITDNERLATPVPQIVT